MNLRLLVLLALLCLRCIDPALAAPVTALSEEEVAVIFDQGMYTGRFSFLVPVAPRVAWDVLTDFEHMAEFVPNLESCRVLSRDASTVTFIQKGRIRFGVLSFAFESERRVDLRPHEGLLLARALSGTARHMASEMRLSAEGTGTRLDYRVEMIPGRWIPSSLGISGMRHEVAEQFSAIATEMVRRNEARPSP